MLVELQMKTMIKKLTHLILDKIDYQALLVDVLWVEFTMNGKLYRARQDLSVVEMIDGVEIQTPSALYQQGVLRGGDRVDGKLVAPADSKES
jgi:hypothetical protein